MLKAVSPHFDLTFDRVVLEKMVDLAPPGLDEFMALTRIIDLLAQNSYRRIVVDSASTGHLIRLLELPELLDRWVKTFFSLLLKYERVVQMPRFTEELIQLSKNLKRFRALLTDPQRAALYTVAIPTQMAFAETNDLLAASRRLGIAAPVLFLNMLTPPSDCPFCTVLRRREGEVVKEFEAACRHQEKLLIYRQPSLAGLDAIELLATISSCRWGPRSMDNLPELKELDDSSRISLCEALDRI